MGNNPHNDTPTTKESIMNVASMKKFYNCHKRKFVIGALIVTTTGTVLMFRNQKQFNAFLKDHDLFDEFYFLTEE